MLRKGEDECPLASGMRRALYSQAPGVDICRFYLSTCLRRVTTLHSSQIILEELPIFGPVLPRALYYGTQTSHL